MDHHSCKLGVFCYEFYGRLTIFIIIGACAGLPALVWSVSELIHHRKNGHRISIFIILLLLTDFVELFTSPYILLKQLLDEFSCMDQTCRVVSALCWSSRDCGILLYQLVALKGFLSVKYPHYTACVFSSPCCIILYIAVLLFISLLDFINYFILKSFLTDLLVLVVSVITWIISCIVSCSIEGFSHTSRKRDYHILPFFIYILLVLVRHLSRLFGFLLLNSRSAFAWHFDNTFFDISHYLISLKLISDPLLCVLVCRQNIRIQTSQTSEEIVQSEEV